MTRRIIRVISLGRISYASGLEHQNACARRLLDGSEPDKSWNTLLVLEHDPVYTVGLRSRDYTPEIEQKLQSLGADFHRTNRGGLITFHGPGQLVAYPVISLKHFQLGMKAYVGKLEQSVLRMCERYWLQATTSEHTGVWVGDKKLAAIGVHGKRFVTTHGLAINCDNDLTWFEHIVPCGIEGKGVTSLSKELGRRVTVAETVIPFLESFAEVFDCELQIGDTADKMQPTELCHTIQKLTQS